jgi:hypothetical protein
MCSESSLSRGIVLLLVGSAFLMANLGVFPGTMVRIWWPLLVIAIGVIKMFAWRNRSRRPYSDFV